MFLVSASMGGTAALKVAAREPVSGVVGISASVEFRGMDIQDDILFVEAPKLFIAAEGDRSAVIGASRLFEASRGPKEIRLFSGSAHGTNIFDSQVGHEMKGLLLEFLSSYTQN